MVAIRGAPCAQCAYARNRRRPPALDRRRVPWARTSHVCTLGVRCGVSPEILCRMPCARLTCPYACMSAAPFAGTRSRALRAHVKLYYSGNQTVAKQDARSRPHVYAHRCNGSFPDGNRRSVLAHARAVLSENSSFPPTHSRVLHTIPCGTLTCDRECCGARDRLRNPSGSPSGLVSPVYRFLLL